MNGKDVILSVLIESNIIPSSYTGQVILHMGQGQICDIECVVTRKKCLGNLLNKNYLDKRHGNMEDKNNRVSFLKR